MKQLVLIFIFLLPLNINAQNREEQINLHLDKANTAYRKAWSHSAASMLLATTGVVYIHIHYNETKYVNSSYLGMGKIMISSSMILGTISCIRGSQWIYHKRKAARIRKGKISIN
jgi:uncharacterized protein with PhoU and TrkA domain